jgi:uncharacterized membrane protein YidH (DUF202 family)
MSFREKSAWISLLAYLAIYGFYFANVASALLSGESDGAHSLGLLSESVVLFVLVTVVLTIVLAISAPKDAQTPEDEREKLIKLKANSAAGYVLATGVVIAIGALYFDAKSFLVINLLFFVLVMFEVFKIAAQLVLTHRGV